MFSVVCLQNISVKWVKEVYLADVEVNSQNVKAYLAVLVQIL